MDRRPTAAGQRRLDNLRQKRNVLRSHSEDAKPLPIARSQQPASGVAPTAAARRRQQVYALTSSSSSSDAEDEPDAVTQVAPSSQELTAKLFAKLGIKGGGGRGGNGGTAGFDSDSSWASSPDRSARIRAVPAAGSDGAAEDKASSLSRASSEATIAALQQELAAARAQADGATQQLRAAESVARSLQERLQAAEQQQLAGSDAHTSALDGVAPDHWQQAQELAAANSQLRDEVSELGGQLAAAAAWQHEVEALGLQLGGMQAAVAESEAARQEQQAELAELLRQRDRELLGATARLAATEAQLAAAQAAGSGAGMQLRPTGDLLAELGISQAELTAALSEAAALLA